MLINILFKKKFRNFLAHFFKDAGLFFLFFIAVWGFGAVFSLYHLRTEHFIRLVTPKITKEISAQNLYGYASATYEFYTLITPNVSLNKHLCVPQKKRKIQALGLNEREQCTGLHMGWGHRKASVCLVLFDMAQEDT